MNPLKQWMSDNNFLLSSEKPAALIFTRHNVRMTNTLNLCGNTIPWVKMYLGLVLDRKLLWTQHILHTKQKCEKGLNMLKFVTKKKYGASPCIGLMFYRAYIRSLLYHGSILYGSASKSNLVTLDRVQLKSILLCIGAMKSSPSCAVLAESQEITLNSRRMFSLAVCHLHIIWI